MVEVECKTPHVQAIEVANWLQESQRFNAAITLLDPADAQEEIKLSGAQTFDLPPGMKKEYKFNVYAYRECQAVVQVVFTNPKTDEYLAFEVAFKFIAPTNLQVIEFKGVACRKTARHPSLVSNPLSHAANFKWEAEH